MERPLAKRRLDEAKAEQEGDREGRSPLNADVCPQRFRGLDTVVVLGVRVPAASGRRARLLGLALLDRDDAGPGLLIPRCRSVHTFGMRFALDLVFLDSAGRVVGLRLAVPPARIARHPDAAMVLELPSP